MKLMIKDLKSKGLQKVINTFSNFMPLIKPWMGSDMRKEVNNNYLGAKIQNKKHHNVEQFVYIECGWKQPNTSIESCTLEEVNVMQRESERDEKQWPNAIVGHVDLRLGKKVETVLIEMKKCKNFRGIRHSLAMSHDGKLHNAECASEGMISDTCFREAFALLSKHDLT